MRPPYVPATNQRSIPSLHRAQLKDVSAAGFQLHLRECASGSDGVCSLSQHCGVLSRLRVVLPLHHGHSNGGRGSRRSVGALLHPHLANQDPTP